jgi:IS605 OrfB family transposase
MSRSKGVVIAVKVPIKWEVMTKRTQKRLRQIVGRDTRVIRAFLGIIEQYEDRLLTGRKHNRIKDGELDKLTMTAIKVKQGYSQRLTVPHDLKARFPRASQNELAECRQTAVFMYESYLELRRKRGRKTSRPRAVNGTRRIPRWVFTQRFKIIQHRTSEANWWLNLRDSLDSVLEGRRVHDKLLIPLKIAPFHLNQMKKGDVKALQIFTDRNRKWWVVFSVSINGTPELSDALPPAVLGIDLGIKKDVCTTLLTPTKVSETRYFVQRDKVKRIQALDQRVANLQHDMAIKRNNQQRHDRLANKLRTIRGKRERVAKEYDRVLVKQLTDYTLELSRKYTLYVAIGRLTNIRMRAQRGNFKGRRFRGMVHRWAFARITESLKHRLSQFGFPVDGKASRFKAIPEQWTSIICWKCGRKGFRPKQSLFVCSCGFRTNADRNGSLNIARRLIKLIPSLQNENQGLGRWAVPERAPAPNAGRKKASSKQKSSLSSKGQVSDLGESAAVHHIQADLLSFGDEAESGDKDHAVAKDAEMLTVTGSDTPRVRQEKEARTVRGIPSR